MTNRLDYVLLPLWILGLVLIVWACSGCDPAVQLDGVTDCGAQYIAPPYTLPGNPEECWALIPPDGRAMTINGESCPGAFGEVRYARGGDQVHYWAALWEQDQGLYGVKRVDCEALP